MSSTVEMKTLTVGETTYEIVDEQARTDIANLSATNVSEDGGYYIPSVIDNEDGTMKMDFTPSKEGMQDVDPITITLPSGADGIEGADGVSATHSWDGTVLTITSASGTSSADLKGDTGPQGIQGEQGETGDSGVGIANITYEASDEDGGSNYLFIDLTDGTGYMYTIQNGSKGSTGPQGAQGTSISHQWIGTQLQITEGDKVTLTDLQGPQGDKGDPYTLTESDKALIVAEVITQLGGTPVFGVLDEDNNILLSGFADGTYTLKYENEDGTYTDIGSLVVGEVAPEIVNLAEPNSTNTTDWTIWCNESRIGSDGLYRSASGQSTTNYIEVDNDDDVYIKGITLPDLTNTICAYDANKVIIGNYRPVNLTSNGYAECTENGDLIHIKFSNGATLANMKYIRISGVLSGTVNDVVITRNQEIS